MFAKLDINVITFLMGLFVFVLTNIIILVGSSWIKTKFANGNGKKKGKCIDGVHCPDHKQIDKNVDKLVLDVGVIKKDLEWLKRYLTGGN